MLRSYQTKAIQSIRNKYIAGVSRQLLCMATGTGKSVVFANLPNETKDILPGQTMLLVHRDELAKQAVEHFRNINPALNVQQEAGTLVCDPSVADVVVASVQSLGRQGTARTNKFNWNNISRLIVDEAHRSITNSYKQVFETGGYLKDNKRLLLGCTATPVRGDGQGLSEIYQSIPFTYSLRQAIDDGWLVDVKGIRVNTKISLDQVSTKGGEYDEKELAETIDTPWRNELVATSYLEHCEGRQAIGFSVNIAHARNLAEVFKKKGINAEWVSGEDPDKADKISRFRKGQIDVLFNAQLLCLDTETEILTNLGWTRYNEMTFDHKVANWREDGTVFFKEPLDIVIRPLSADEHMVSINSKMINLRVTDTHRMLIKSGGKKDKWNKISASNLLKHHVLPSHGIAPPSIVEFNFKQSLYSSRRVSANAFALRKNYGMTYEESITEARKREIHRNNLKVKHPSELTLDECKLIGFWIADGSRVSNKIRGGIEYTLAQSTVYPYIIKWVDSLLNRLNIDKVRHDNSNYPNPHIKWSLCRGTGGGSLLRNGVFAIEPYLDKNGSSLLWGLDEAQFDAIVEGYWYGDGHHGSASKGFPKSICFNDTKKSWIDLLCAIGSVRGWKCAVMLLPSKNIKHKDQWYLRMIKGKNICISQKTDIKHEKYSPETVWCVNTDTKNIITRRKGKVTVMGNTEGFDCPPISCVIMAAPTKSGVVFSQRVGRGTRLFDGKSDVIILDMVDTSARHSLITLPTLLGLPSKLDLKGTSLTQAIKKIEEIQAQYPHLDFTELEDITKVDSWVTNVNLFEIKIPAEIDSASEFIWHPTATGGYVLMLPDKDEIRITQNLLDTWELRGKIRNKTYKGDRNTLEEALAAADKLVMDVAPDVLKIVQKEAKWHNDPPTPGQLKLLKKLYKGKQIPDNLTKGMVSKLIGSALAKD